jgi:hypothetical protein
MNMRRAQLSHPALSAARLLQLYMWLIMVLLLVQGSGSLLLGLRPDVAALVPEPLATIMNGNLPHAILHIAWGTFGLFVLATQRSDRVRRGLGLTFGLFYTLLGFLGLVVHNPFGMRLAWQENLFHLTVGPLMLALTLLAWRALATGDNLTS